MQHSAKRQLWFTLLYGGIALSMLYFVRSSFTEPAPRQVPYSELVSLVRARKVASVELRNDTIVGALKPAEQATEQPEERADGRGAEGPGREAGAGSERVVAERLPGIEEKELLNAMLDAGVEVRGKHEQQTFWAGLFFSFAPVLLLVGLYYWGMRRMGRASGPMTLGKNRAKIYDVSASNRVTFNDVAGVDEAEGELVEVVKFLKEPEKYRALGARIPKGVLLVGPPGTGKTLLARAVAGEAAVPFFSLSGSEFVEMFVGVGAARMRDLFEQAKQRAPCIVFIDELDAIGKSRGGMRALATNDEREQTLNQLLVEVDGFDTSSGVIIMAATNRPEVLDQALLRAGRFDRQVLVDRPDVRGREEILRVHVRTISLGADVDLRVVAQRTPGMVGADLANVVNEAALAAVRRGGTKVELVDFEEAIDRIQLGLKKRGRVMSEDEKRRVAYHESGHTLVALSVPRSDPVHRVTIIPRSIGALGATLQLPTEERYLVTREELEDRICVMMGGRVAEEICCGEQSTGAQNDLERATETARQMVTRLGMSDRMGPMTFGQSLSARFLESPLSLGEERNYSEKTAQALDEEVQAILSRQHTRAKEILVRRKEALERLAERLIVEETLERKDIEAMLGAAPDRLTPPGRGPHRSTA